MTDVGGDSRTAHADQEAPGQQTAGQTAGQQESGKASGAGVRLESPGLVRAWIRGATAALRRERGVIDRVNVFPVADADTGTNLYLTLREGDRAVADAPADTSGPRLLAVLARAALLGARGNSGVILSEWLRGLAVAARQGDGPADLLARAARSARSAVASPADGTILTAADAAAAAARVAESDAGSHDAGSHDAGAHEIGVRDPEVREPDVLRVVTAAAAAARAAARASTDELAELRAAGVLDAGALGLVLVLDALVVATADAAASGAADTSGTADAGGSARAVSVGRGTMDAVNLDQLLDAGTSAGRAPWAATGTETAAVTGADTTADTGPGTGALELMFVLETPADAATEHVAARLRGALAEVGDSVVVVGGDAGTGTAVWQAHVHTDHLDRALAIAAEAARAGSLAQVHVRHLAAVDQHAWGVVAATTAPALAGELARAGAVVLLTGGVGSPVEPLTADDVERAAASTGARRVLLLGPVPDPSPSAEAHPDVDELVAVPTPTDVHAVVVLAALGTLLPIGLPDAPDAPEQADARALADEALAGLTVVDTRAADAVAELRASATPAATVVTALLDADVPDDLPDRLAAALGERAPDAELVVLTTGRPGVGVRIGTEVAVGQEPEGES